MQEIGRVVIGPVIVLLAAARLQADESEDFRRPEPKKMIDILKI